LPNETQIDAFTLLKNSGGSGYDIACAQNGTRLFFSDKDALPLKKIQIQSSI
jgi:hypothetical protein